MKTIASIIGTFIVLLVVILALSWVAMGNNFFLYKFFAPKQAAVQREVFLNTPSYVQGMNQEIQNEMFKYYENTNNQSVMSSLILQQTASFPLEQMTPDNRTFVMKLRSEKTNQQSY